MKKLLLLTIASFLTATTFAQKIKLQKITYGVVAPVSGTMTLTSPLKPFVLGYNLLPNIVFITNKTYHNFLYGMGNNVFRTIQGYKLKKDLGIYLALQKSLDKKTGYLGTGIEKFIPVTENITCFLFCEVGKNMGVVKSTLAIMGMHINIQSPIWKKPKK